MSFTQDSTVNRVLYNYIERSNLGIEKYGKTMSGNLLGRIEWLRHLQEELMDATLYIERAIEELSKPAITDFDRVGSIQTTGYLQASTDWSNIAPYQVVGSTLPAKPWLNQPRHD